MIGNYFQDVALSLYTPVGWLFLILLLRVLLRRQWIAVVAALLFATVTALPGSPNKLVFFVYLLVAFGMFLFVLIRFGLLAPVFWALYMWLPDFVVLTLDSSAWYAGRSFFTLALFAAIALYACRISLGGRWPVVPDMLAGS